MIASTQSYRVGTGPLEIWAIVAATAPSRWWVPHSRCGAPRDALLDGSLPYHCWAFCSMVCWRGGVGPRSSITHQLGGCRWAPPGVCVRFYADAAHVIAFVTMLGAIAVLGTVALSLAALSVRRGLQR